MMNIEQGIVNDEVISKTLESYFLPFGEGLGLTVSGGDGAFIPVAISFVCRLTNAYVYDKLPDPRHYRN
jgi:hypothetical protein